MFILISVIILLIIYYRKTIFYNSLEDTILIGYDTEDGSMYGVFGGFMREIKIP